MIDIQIQTFLIPCREMNYCRTAELLNRIRLDVMQHIYFWRHSMAASCFAMTEKCFDTHSSAFDISADIRICYPKELGIAPDTSIVYIP